LGRPLQKLIDEVSTEAYVLSKDILENEEPISRKAAQLSVLATEFMTVGELKAAKLILENINANIAMTDNDYKIIEVLANKYGVNNLEENRKLIEEELIVREEGVAAIVEEREDIQNQMLLFDDLDCNYPFDKREHSN
jgi:hypothetical protein